MKHTKTFLFVAIFLFALKSNAQIGEGGMPQSFGNSSCKSKNSVHCIHFPTLDNNSLLIADSCSLK
jgi:hypothetical protein